MRWFSSDLHAGHVNIRNLQPCRPEHFEKVYFDNWIRLVAPQDTVYFLGDLVFGSKDYRLFFADGFSRLPGHKIFVRGNHDKKRTDEYLTSCGFEEIHDPDLFLPDRRWLLSHYPLTCIDERRVRELAFILADYDELGAVANIHGHSHSAHSPDDRCVNVSVEVCDMAPISEDEVAKRVKEKRST